MAAFDKILSGYPAMDQFLDSIRLGDNVVWKVNELNEFQEFAQIFVKQAITDQRNVIYVRFAQNEPFFQEMEGLKIYRFNPEEGFESFTVAIHQMIANEGRDAFIIGKYIKLPKIG